MSEKQKNLSDSTSTIFYIVGHMRRLQNELIASFLESNTRNDCVVLENISQISLSNPKSIFQKSLVFWDCQGKNPNGLLAELSPYINNNGSESRVVLFNVPTDMEFHKKFVLKGIHGFFYNHDPLDNFLKIVNKTVVKSNDDSIPDHSASKNETQEHLQSLNQP